MKKSISPILGFGPSVLHVWLFLERGRARKMWQLSINHPYTQIPRASLACRFAEKRGGKNFEACRVGRRYGAVSAVGWMFNPFKTSCMFTNHRYPKLYGRLDRVTFDRYVTAKL